MASEQKEIESWPIKIILARIVGGGKNIGRCQLWKPRSPKGWWLPLAMDGQWMRLEWRKGGKAGHVHSLPHSWIQSAFITCAYCMPNSTMPWGAHNMGMDTLFLQLGLSRSFIYSKNYPSAFALSLQGPRNSPPLLDSMSGTCDLFLNQLETSILQTTMIG